MVATPQQQQQQQHSAGARAKGSSSRRHPVVLVDNSSSSCAGHGVVVGSIVGRATDIGLVAQAQAWLSTQQWLQLLGQQPDSAAGCGASRERLEQPKQAQRKPTACPSIPSGA
jgi:hypothetical protein